MRSLFVATFVALSLSTAALGLETEVESGPVRAVVRLAPDAPVIGDRLTLEIEVVAEPDVEVLMPEFGEALDRFSILDFVPRQGLDDAGNTKLTQRYTLQAPMSGDHVLPSLLVEFVDRRPGRDAAPEGQVAYELLSDPIPFSVESLVPDAASAELSPPAPRLDPLPTGDAFPWWWIVVAALVALGLAPFAWRAFVAMRARARRRSAWEVATTELAALADVPRQTEAEIDAFFVRLSWIVRRYLEDRFGLRSPEYTTEEFLDRMKESPDLTRAHQQVLASFLEQADLVKFAHRMPDASAIDEAFANARRFVDETREDAERGAYAHVDDALGGQAGS